jgi:hypothetical protein
MSPGSRPALTRDEEFIDMLQASLAIDGGDVRVADQIRARLHALVDQFDCLELVVAEVALRRVVDGEMGAK